MISFEDFTSIINIGFTFINLGISIGDAFYSNYRILVKKCKKRYKFWQISLRVVMISLMISSFFKIWTKIITICVSITTLVIPWLIRTHYFSQKMHLPPVTQKGFQKKVYIGRLKSHIFPKKIYLSENDVKRHMFITGLTGMGKSNFVKQLLFQLASVYPHVPFLLIEFKGEYKTLHNDEFPITIHRPGDTLKINIFNPRGANPKVHAEKIMNLLISCQIITFQDEYSPQMEKIFVEILYKICSDPKRRNWEGFDYYIKQLMNENKSKYYNIQNTISGIENRIRRLKNGPMKTIFSEDLNFDLQEIIQTNTIIDLSSIIQCGGSKKDAVFFSNILFNHVWQHNIKRGSCSEINHFTLIEDSQFLLSQKSTNHLKSSTYLEDFALLLRGTGECLITINTRPTISEDVMANAGVIISFQISYDQQLMGKLLSLKEKKIFYLTLLDIGECIIKTNSIPTPFMIRTPLIESKLSRFE